MFNEKRIDDIRNKIKVSTLLSDHEKSDWLNLLDLMNDKQLGELEDILGMSVSSATVSSAPTATPGSQMPPLNHISNIPSDVTMTFASQTATDAQKAPSIEKLVTVEQSSQPVVPKPLMPPKPILPPVAPIPRQAIVQPSKQGANPESLNLQDAQEIQAFTANTLRQFDFDSIVSAVRKTIERYGYFRILQLFEASELHKSYITTGKVMLGHASSKDALKPESMLTQAEFEFVTDLLRHMRFNAW